MAMQLAAKLQHGKASEKTASGLYRITS